MEDNRLPELREVSAEELYPLVDMLSIIGVTEVFKSIPQDVLQKAAFQTPTKMDGKGGFTEIPRDQWTKKQTEAWRESQVAAAQIGAACMQMVMSRFSTIREPLERLICLGTGLTAEELHELPGGDYVRLVKGYFDREGFTDFFMQAVSLQSELMGLMVSAI